MKLEKDNLKNLTKELERLGDEIVKLLQKKILNNKPHPKVNTGRLLKSIKYKVIKTNKGLALNIMANDTFKYVDDGRKKGKMPPSNVLIPWIQYAGIQPMSDSGKMVSLESLSFVMARNIGERGIKPMKLTKGINTYLKAKQAKISQDVKKSLLIDIPILFNKEKIFK